MTTEKMNPETQETRSPGRVIVSILLVLLVVAVMVVLFLNRARVNELGNWGYLGAFLIGLVSSATVFIPMPGLLLLFALGATFNPFLVGVISAAGGAIGELTGYALGYTGHSFISRSRIYIKTQNWMKRWGAAAIFVFALVPFLPIDVIGLVAGVSRFPVWKFLLATWGGKAILYTVMALGGTWGWDLVYRWFS